MQLPMILEAFSFGLDFESARFLGDSQQCKSLKKQTSQVAI